MLSLGKILKDCDKVIYIYMFYFVIICLYFIICIVFLVFYLERWFIRVLFVYIECYYYNFWGIKEEMCNWYCSVGVKNKRL